MVQMVVITVMLRGENHAVLPDASRKTDFPYAVCAALSQWDKTGDRLTSRPTS